MTVTEAPPRRSDQGTLPVAPSLPAERRRGRLGSIAVGQLVAAEAAVVAVVATIGRPVWLQVAVGVFALVLVVAAFARRDGRWWYESVSLRRRFRRRARAAAAAARTDPATVSLARLGVGFAAADVVDRRTRFGVGRDAGGFFVAFEVLPQPGADARPDAALGLDQLAGLLASGTVPLSALQVVLHVAPAPTGVLDRRAPSPTSYLELLRDAVVPADQRIWVAGRLAPADAAVAAATRGGGVPGVHRALAAAVGRLDKALESAGTPGRVLDAAQLAAAVAGVAGVSGDAPGGADAAREDWRSWQTAEGAHVTLALADLPRRPLPELFGQLCRLPLLAATVSIVLSPGRDGEVFVEGLLRISAQHDLAEEAVRSVTGVCQAAGATVRRLDGQHAEAVYAVAPTGGGTDA